MKKNCHILLFLLAFLSCSRKAAINETAITSLPANDANNLIPQTALVKSADEAAAIQMQTVQTKNDKKPAIVSNLKGNDRRLLLKPLNKQYANDFILGQTGPFDSKLATVLENLRTSLLKASMDYSYFTENCAALSRLLYKDGFLDGIYELRFGQAKEAPGSSYSLNFRVFLKKNDILSVSTGTVLLVKIEDGVWRIQHFELDIPPLSAPRPKTELWDPYQF